MFALMSWSKLNIWQQLCLRQQNLVTKMEWMAVLTSRICSHWENAKAEIFFDVCNQPVPVWMLHWVAVENSIVNNATFTTAIVRCEHYLRSWKLILCNESDFANKWVPSDCQQTSKKGFGFKSQPCIVTGTLKRIAHNNGFCGGVDG